MIGVRPAPGRTSPCPGLPRRAGNALASLRRQLLVAVRDVCSWMTLSKFFVVGGTGIVVNNLALALLYAGAHLPLLVASVTAVEIAVVYNFLLDNRWAFGRRDVSLRRFARFNLASLGALVVNTSVLWLLVIDVRLEYLAANLAAIGAASVVNLAGAGWTWGFGR